MKIENGRLKRIGNLVKDMKFILLSPMSWWYTFWYVRLGEENGVVDRSLELVEVELKARGWLPVIGGRRAAVSGW